MESAMQRTMTIGHCCGLSNMLRVLGYQANTDHDLDRYANPSDTPTLYSRTLFMSALAETMDYLLDALIGIEPIDPEYEIYVEKLRAFISNDDELHSRITNGRVIKITVDERDLFLLEEV